jgi:hypothetical protein
MDALRQKWLAMGLRSGQDIAMIAFSYAPHVFLWDVHYAFNLMGVPIIPGSSMDTARRIMFLTTFKPTVLCATPSYAFYLGNRMLEMGPTPQESAITTLVVDRIVGIRVWIQTCPTTSSLDAVSRSKTIGTACAGCRDDFRDDTWTPPMHFPRSNVTQD